MEWMDRIRRVAGLAWIAGGTWSMLLWSATQPRPGAGSVTWVVSAVVALAAALQLSAPQVRWWAARLAGLVIGVLLLGAVADRFGLLGASGDPGVSWGDWSHFRAETAELVPWSPLVSSAAVAATGAELLLGAMLVAGLQWRWTGKLAAGLFVVYLVTMIPGLGPASVLQYGVPVLIGGCLLSSARGEPLGRQHQCGTTGNLPTFSGVFTPAGTEAPTDPDDL